MSDMTRKVMQTLKVGAKAVARAVSSGMKTVKFKLDELGTNSKRRDLFNELGKKVYELSQAGEELPLAAAGLTQQIQELDESFEKLRADYEAQKAEVAAVRTAEKEARGAAKAAAAVNDAAYGTQDGGVPQTEDATADEAPVDQEKSEDDQPDVPTLNV